MSFKSPLPDQWQDRKSRSRTRQELAELGVLAQSIGELGLAELRGKVERGEPLNLTVDQIINLVTVGAELERRVREEPPDLSRPNHQTQPS